MRISDWSSDVCSSDLGGDGEFGGEAEGVQYLLADRFIEEMADGIAEQPAQDRGDGADQPEADRAFRAGEAHQAQQRVRREGEEADSHKAGGEERALGVGVGGFRPRRSEAHTSELQSLMRISYAGFCLKKTNNPSSGT